ITADQIVSQGIEAWPFGALGPDLDDALLSSAKSWITRFLRLADPSATALENFVCGANRSDQHRIGTNWSKLGGKPKSVDLRKAQAGDCCIHDSSQILEEQRGIEVGHIFQLGRKYSQALEAHFTNDKGTQEPFWMGCYGIGISRLAQAAVEQHHDEAGISWPLAIAPFEVIVVVANLQDEPQQKLAEQLYSELQAAGIDTLLDDRNERAGVKFKDADLIGIPWRIVVGRDATKAEVELVKRSSREVRKLPATQALAELIEEIGVNNH
ncbi:MAG: His/Gly/Thr/Pro-type tRNA ligase C-terminal domain-containing protein, partial [Prochlorococcus sp.]